MPKYIWVISVTEDVAVAQYYVEGSYQEVGQPPVAGGSGTKQTAIGG